VVSEEYQRCFLWSNSIGDKAWVVCMYVFYFCDWALHTYYPHYIPEEVAETSQIYKPTFYQNDLAMRNTTGHTTTGTFKSRIKAVHFRDRTINTTNITFSDQQTTWLASTKHIKQKPHLQLDEPKAINEISSEPLHSVCQHGHKLRCKLTDGLCV
jgi:hypothetical protein